MSMLAGPRCKQKVINLRAKNNLWSNDSNKFGQKMLEKMGWSSGKGLGANENGIVEHVVARYKNDEKGLGYEDKNDQWTKHEDDFNALLANLSNGPEDDKMLHSGISLEHKSKKSKARVHYHKFTRGKDLSRYSEKDLANIFGKKSLHKVAEPIKEEYVADIKLTEQVFTEGGSMEDYFKSKIKTNKSNKKQENEVIKCDQVNYAFQGFSSGNDNFDDETNGTHQGFGFQPFSFYKSEPNNMSHVDVSSCENNVSTMNTEVSKKTKKKQKNENDTSITEYSNVASIDITVINEDNIRKRKSKKKNKNKLFKTEFVAESQNIIIENIDQDVVNIESTIEKKKNKKSKLNKSIQRSDNNLDSFNQTLDNCSKKSKLKNKSLVQVDEPAAANNLSEESYSPKKKKKRKNVQK